MDVTSLFQMRLSHTRSNSIHVLEATLLSPEAGLEGLDRLAQRLFTIVVHRQAGGSSATGAPQNSLSWPKVVSCRWQNAPADFLPFLAPLFLCSQIETPIRSLRI